MTRIGKSRLEGIIYLITVLTGIFSLMYVPKQLIFTNDIAQTVINLQENEFLFRLAIISELICYLAFLLLPIALYRHFEFYNHQFAKIMVYLVIIGATISCFAISYKIGVLEFLNQTNILAEKLHNLVSLNFKSYYNTIKIAKIFWGLWLIPFGYLGFISGKIPRILCLFLIIGGVGYQINFVGGIVFPQFKETIIPRITKIPSSIGEIGTCLWLLIVGIKKADNTVYK